MVFNGQIHGLWAFIGPFITVYMLDLGGETRVLGPKTASKRTPKRGILSQVAVKRRVKCRFYTAADRSLSTSGMYTAAIYELLGLRLL